MVRKAEPTDITQIMSLLYQVNAVHNRLRPDLFKGGTTKYNEQELETIIGNPAMPIFVFEEDGQVMGHAFCQISDVHDHRLLQDIKTLYIDDICVDENRRNRHVGRALYEHVCDYARSIGCYNITLNVWEGNESAYSFYRSMGMRNQKTGMEYIL